MHLQEQLAFALPNMERVRVRKDVTYKTVDDTALRLDIYYPNDTNENAPRPAVLFLHGDAPHEILQDAKEWHQYVQWGQLVAAGGLIGITSNHRSTEQFTRLEQAAQDIADLIALVRERAAEFQIDSERLCLWACSAGGPVTLSAALRDVPPYVRCIVAYYCLLDLQHLRPNIDSSITDEILRAFSPLYHLSQGDGNIAPMLIARAGRDNPVFNNALDAFSMMALAKNAPVEIINHPTGQHAFDVRDQDERSREIIERTLGFMRQHLLAYRALSKS